MPVEESRLPIRLTPLVKASDSLTTACNATGGDGDAASEGDGDGVAGAGSACAPDEARTIVKTVTSAAETIRKSSRFTSVHPTQD
jgi:hypothetical protein